ncbi:hypothetical protein DM860_014144 [Cuscuta australis]|uniref:Uncharacterized protein n=1 Tax=Cuscuta australis TaxID=267555 RepID=A0A328DE48_9ASTE|nr:hypothetical protein DM860_014144 [Cuscuta australis]
MGTVQAIVDEALEAGTTVVIFVETEEDKSYGTTYATIEFIHRVIGEDNSDKIVTYVVPETSKNALLGTLCDETGSTDTELPAVYIGGELVGGSKAIYSLHLQGSLKRILQHANP